MDAAVHQSASEHHCPTSSEPGPVIVAMPVAVKTWASLIGKDCFLRLNQELGHRLFFLTEDSYSVFSFFFLFSL